MTLSFWIIGHRGAMDHAPENTMRSFRRAVDDGVDVIELDLRMSSDGSIVVIHDATVDRTTDGTGAVADLSLADLRELDAGEGEHIPTFEEVVSGVQVLIQAEIKHPSVVQPLVRLLEQHPDLQNRILPTSFDDELVAAVANQVPGAACGWISSDPTEEQLQHAQDLGVRRVLFSWAGTDPAIIARAHRLGLQYNLRPGETVDDILRARSWGADGITTNDPALRQCLEAGGRTH